ncbi:MAG: Uma2 family endonuclease [Chitinophagaceae bacterium]|nr:Uma2 family endonuclease [Chitinophagaceae bacterium]
MEVLEQIPKTALDVFRLLPEGTMCEVIDNILYMSPAPKYTHQRLVLLLARKLSNHIETFKIGEIFIAPVDVYFEDLASAVQPDLLYVANENRGIMHPDGYIYGAPDIVIEVLSSDRKRDLVLKKGLYERAGVKEYFIADPVTRKMQLYSLNGGSYQLVYDETGLFKSTLLNLEFVF